MTRINLPDGDSATFSGEADKDDANIARNAESGPERLEAFAFESIAEANGNASRVPKRSGVEDFEQIEVSRDARDGSPWTAEKDTSRIFCVEGIQVEVEILSLYATAGDSNFEVELGAARIIEAVSFPTGQFLFRKDDVIPLTEAEEEKVRAQFLAHKRSMNED